MDRPLQQKLSLGRRKLNFFYSGNIHVDISGVLVHQGESAFLSKHPRTDKRSYISHWKMTTPKSHVRYNKVGKECISTLASCSEKDESAKNPEK